MSGQQPVHKFDTEVPSAGQQDWQDEQRALRDQAERCRRLAGALYTRENSMVLQQMADRFEQSAQDLDNKRQA